MIVYVSYYSGDDDRDNAGVLCNRERRAELCKVIDDIGSASARVRFISYNQGYH